MSANGVVKAALLLMALDPEEAAGAFRHFDRREVQKISTAMAALKNVAHSDVDEAVYDFIAQAQTHTTLALDADQYLRSVLNRSLGEDKAGAVLDRILVGGGISGIEGLRWLEPPAVAELIRNEHPQIIASVLVHLDPQHASSVLACFTERIRNDALLRIATLDGIHSVAIRELDHSLNELLAGGVTAQRRGMGGPRVAAGIINDLSSQQEDSVIGSVRDCDSQLAQQIVDEMFNFEKLLTLDDSSIRRLLRDIDLQALIVALKVGPQELTEKFMANMSQRSADLFAEDMEARGPVRLSEVEMQQRAIMQVVRRLAESGEIVLGDKPGDVYA
ncbi:flagellar motor switch protein FliG [Paraburkholderia caledonica]|uniref:flagellar motor switch protein FliG n=1 Tax=Paraburkholderia caledonica TaxID=134536 RepID=UPI000377772E|nr:flagellar motor switch protein FliG [Paraburkholderia caledonica]